MIDEDVVFSDQEDIQKKYDQMDNNNNKEGISLNDEMFEKFDDLNENISDLQDDSLLQEAFENKILNKYISSNNNETDISRLLDVIKEENDILKKKEQKIKENFEKLKNDYSRISKDKKTIENKKIRL